jgi:ATP-dependent Clp protease ATP-binding subunit ClpA
VFERFTDKARQVVVLAQDEARALNHNYIGTEHILLGLLREKEGLAAQVLESLDITLEEVRAQVARIIGQGEVVAAGQIPFTPRTKKVLELSMREALALGHNYIGTEHILLGLMRENEGVAARILLDFDADAEKIQGEVIRMLGGPAVFGTQATQAEEQAAAAADPELSAELARVRDERKAALESKEFDKAAALRIEEGNIRRRLLGIPEVRVALPPFRPRRRFGRMPKGSIDYAVRSGSSILLGWLLFGVALGIGILVGWLIWG